MMIQTVKRIIFIYLFLFYNLIVSGQNLPNDTAPQSEGRFIEYETGPSFPGGEIARICFFSNNLNHDIVSSTKLTEGKVFVRFEVDTIGRISKIEILRHYNKDIDQEILRVIERMPNWTPAEILKGYPNEVWTKRVCGYTLPFKIPYMDQCP